MEIYDDLPNSTPYGNTSGSKIDDNYYDYLYDNNIENNDLNSSTIVVHQGHPIESVMSAQPSSLKKNHLYGRYYHLIGSCIVMVIIPVTILMKAYCSFRKAMPSGSHKIRTHKIMLIIITMFIICHCPKVRTIQAIKIN